MNEEIRKNILETKYNKPSKEELKEKLTALQYEVTQNAKTERPYQNEYDDLFQKGCLLYTSRLMETKVYDDITVTEICRMAGVSRMTYYRNYSSCLLYTSRCV